MFCELLARPWCRVIQGLKGVDPRGPPYIRDTSQEVLMARKCDEDNVPLAQCKVSQLGTGQKDCQCFLPSERDNGHKDASHKAWAVTGG